MQNKYLQVKFYQFCILLCLGVISCTKEEETATEPKLILRFRFDSTQQRLDNTGQLSTLPDDHGAQSPVMNKMSAHYIELASSNTTALGKGTIIYKAEETTLGGDTAIYFDKSVLAGNNEVFYAIALKDVAPGEYEWLRLSLAYQHYTIQYHVDENIGDTLHIDQDFSGTLASFIGYNTYITSYQINSQVISINENRSQGYWGFESNISYEDFSKVDTIFGQAPAITVVNPLFATSPVPAGSCVVTGAFAGSKLTITGKETENIIIEVAVSTNKSFEWQEVVKNGKWDPAKGETVVDMGVRGIIPTVW
ncbi:MAG: hypothetical protein BGP13_14705 [Sphingobacteriales bacterium 40-81]|nr:MAG: hypothetical protein BGP13_14705 [Sphingobacteriales bacterium 40-81]